MFTFKKMALMLSLATTALVLSASPADASEPTTRQLEHERYDFASSVDSSGRGHTFWKVGEGADE